MRIALGMVIRDFVGADPVMTFLDNADAYSHKIDDVIVAYSGSIDEDYVRTIEQRSAIRVHAIKVGQAQKQREALSKRGVSGFAMQKLLTNPVAEKSPLVPYGFNRNNVLIEAMLSGVDVLVFIDDDVEPAVLKKSEHGAGTVISHEGVDFFGTHLAGIDRGAKITTSDYSGYNILPYAHFDGMEELLLGLQKENMLEFWLNSLSNDCLYIQRNDPPIPKRTRKALGGNMAMDLRSAHDIPPFFSPTYEVRGTTYLARGEDTLIANMADELNIECLDVDMHIFHNTYGDYPRLPSLEHKKDTQERFFYACMGWIGRNPFMNYLQQQDTVRLREKQKANLEIGVRSLCEYTGNDIFAILPEAHDAAWESLPDIKIDYEQTMSAWEELLTVIEKGETI